MRNIFKVLLLSAVIAPAVVSCDEDPQLPAYVPVKVGQDFSKGEDESLLAITGWTNYNEVGSKKWMIQRYKNESYAEFSSYLTGELSNIGWLITPVLDLNDGKDHKLTFLSSQSYVSSSANKLEVLISKDYDGTNVTAATWTPLSATLPTTSSKYFAFINSGDVNLAAYTGSKVHIAFKVTGSGTNADLDGSYQIDNVIVQ